MEIREQLLEHLKEYRGRAKAFMLTFTSGQISRERLFMNSHGELCMMYKGRRRIGHHFSACDVVSFKVINKGARIKKLTPAQQYVRELLTRKKYINKHCHHNLWPELRAEVAKITDENVDAFLKAEAAAGSHYEAWHEAHKYNLPQIEGHKTLTLKTALGKWSYLQHVMKEVEDAIENKKEYVYRWRNGYDYSVHVSFASGTGRAWLSQEFKDCGNGHYWLLINTNNAIFCEND